MLKARARNALGLIVGIGIASSVPLSASDTILVHGHVYTGNAGAKWTEAVAVTAGKIDAVGSDKDISRRRDVKTKVIDLEGRTVIPGILDSHTHMWYGGLALRGFNFATPEIRLSADDPAPLLARIKEYAANHPNEKVLFGRMQYSTGADSKATRQLLDQAVPDRPVVVHGTGEHSLWVNSKALEMAGITDKPVANPLEERYIGRDGQGHPIGTLRDPAMQLMVRALPAEPLDERMAVLRNAAHYLNSFGITSVVNATGNLKEIEAYAALRDRGELAVRTRTSFAEVSVRHHLTPEFLADLEKARTTYHDEWVSANLVKFFADGAGSTSTTSQYETGFSGAHSPGWYEPEEYQTILIELDKHGYQIMTHAIGNAAIHMVLDSYEQLEKVNGPKDRRLRIEHGANIIPDDVPRFAKLSVIDSLQQPNAWQSLLKTGAKTLFSSDWPVAWPPDPFIGIERDVLRQLQPQPSAPEVSPPDGRLLVEQALDAYTKTAAYARFSDKQIGTLETGKLADLVVLSQDIFSVAPGDIGKTRVLMTMVGGKIVFERTR